MSKSKYGDWLQFASGFTMNTSNGLILDITDENYDIYIDEYNIFQIQCHQQVQSQSFKISLQNCYLVKHNKIKRK